MAIVKSNRQSVKKLLIILVLLMLTATVVAAPGNFAERARATEIPVEINVTGMILEDFLAFISEQSGISILAVPELADVKINLRLAAGKTLGQVFEELRNGYHLSFQFNDTKAAIVVVKAPYHEGRYLTAAPNVLVKANRECYEDSSIVGGGMYPAAAFNTEEYKRVYDNNFQYTLTSALSTFSIDVDTASYSNVRRFINSGKLPAADAVRTEEMINYFNYGYPQPTGEHPFSVTTEVSDCPWQQDHQLVMVGLQGQSLGTQELPPGNLVFLIDVSGSMDEPNKLPLLKTTFKMLVKQLRAQDKVSIVVYAGAAGVVLEPTYGSERDKIITAIDNLQAGGSTAGGEGIALAYKIAKDNFAEAGNNRVILATDGDFNVGVSSEGELVRMIEQRRDDGISLSVLGFGMGNIKDNKMEALADKGNGNYAYIDNALEARKVMVGQLAGTLYTIAKDVKFQVEFNPAKVKYYRLIGYENRVMENSDFTNDKKDAGDMGAGHSVTALYEIIPVGSEEAAGRIDPLAYQRLEIVASDDLLQVKIRYKEPAKEDSILFAKRVGPEDVTSTPSENFKFAAAVAEYAMLLRNCEFKGQATYQQVLELAKSAIGHDDGGYRAEFIKMVEISQLLDENKE